VFKVVLARSIVLAEAFVPEPASLVSEPVTETDAVV
jgi:hypothetical protein